MDKDGSQVWRAIREVGSFCLGVYLLVRTSNPTTVVGLIALVLMGVLPLSVLDRFINRNGSGDAGGKKE